jgi:hypothetical protein
MLFSLEIAASSVAQASNYRHRFAIIMDTGTMAPHTKQSKDASLNDRTLCLVR